MEWHLSLLLILGTLIVLMASGMPLAFCFMLVNVLGAFIFWGGAVGLQELVYSFSASVTHFSFLPLPLFILMGEVMLHSGIVPNMIDAIDKWLGRLPGRLSLLAVAGGTLLSTLTGTSMASVAMLGSALVPEMVKRGYKKPMSLGPILGSGGLDMMIPPSGLAVLLGALGEISIGKILIAIVVPGLLMAVLYAFYIVTRAHLQASTAPAYDVAHVPLKEKLIFSVRYLLPVGFIVFMVVGLIFLEVATPTEAAATGALSCFILTACYGRLNREVVKNSLGGALRVVVMILILIVGAAAFSQILAFSGATTGLLELALRLHISPLFMLIVLQLLLMFMGTFMELVSIMMITIPIFMPVVHALGFNPVWFAVIYLLNMEMAQTTPPFGMSLFVMKGVAPAGTTMADIYLAGLPFLLCDLIVMALIIAFPDISLWLPSLALK